MKPAASILIDGPAGKLEIASSDPEAPPRAVAVVAHPHPLHGGTMENKVVVTLVKAFFRLGYTTTRFNFRGVGKSQGSFDEGRGEIDDALAALAHARLGREELPLVLAGFSFGARVQAMAQERLRADGISSRLVLVAPVGEDFPQVPADTLVIHGENDELQPLKPVLDWAAPQQLAVVVVPAASHFFHGCLTVLTSILASNFR
ncbi:MAG: alpha/beta hydrolase [Burkholderiales bacterium]